MDENVLNVKRAKEDGRIYALKQLELLYKLSKKTKSPAKLAKLSEAMAHLYGELNSF